MVERVATAVGFFLTDFGFFASRLLRFCPFAIGFPLSPSARLKASRQHAGRMASCPPWHGGDKGSQMSSTEFANILLERQGAVGIVTLNRPQALNALNAALIAELGVAFDELEGDPAIAAIILTGSEKAF